jgi:hypothetical protein
MSDATTTEIRGMVLRWRIVCVLIIAILQVLLVWTSIHFALSWDSWRLLLFALITIALVTTGYEIAKKGRLTRLTFFSWLCLFVSNFVRDVHRFWNHDPNVDFFFTLLMEAFYILIALAWIWKNPFGARKIDPATIKPKLT